MKTLLELNALIPTIIALMSKEEPEIGNYEENDYQHNIFTYQEDGWDIEIEYRCTGDYYYEAGDYYTPSFEELERAWGEVDEIRVFHYDDETEDETEFTGEDLTDLTLAVNKYLKDLPV